MRSNHLPGHRAHAPQFDVPSPAAQLAAKVLKLYTERENFVYVLATQNCPMKTAPCYRSS